MLALSATMIRQVKGSSADEEPVQTPDRVLEDRLLVVDGDDDVDLGGLLGRRGHGTQDGRSVDGACVLERSCQQDRQPPSEEGRDRLRGL